MKMEMSNLRSGGSAELRGKLVAQLLRDAWKMRTTPTTLSTEELDKISTVALRSGTAALAWNSLRNSELSKSKAAQQFRQAYLSDSIQAALSQHHLKRVISLLRSGGVEPLLVKGWAVARLYPELGFRPYCDLDLCVAPEDYSTAKAVLQDSNVEIAVDLHAGFEKFYDRNIDDILGRSELVKLDDVEVRVLGPEDNLRFLCLHLLRHGATRPIWLCDTGVLLQNSATNFDWDLCLTGSQREVNWIVSA